MTFIAIATVVTNMEDVGAAVAVAVKASQALASLATQFNKLEGVGGRHLLWLSGIL